MGNSTRFSDSILAQDPLSQFQQEQERKKPGSFSQRILEELEAAEESETAALVNQLELGTEELPVTTRANIAAADTLAEQIQALRKKFPEGELIRIPVSGQLVFRKDPSKPFSEVDPKEFEIQDVAEFLAGDIGAILGETAATVGFRGTNLLPLLGRIFVGGTAGELAQQEVERIAGLELEPRSETLLRAPGKGLAGVGGALIMSPLSATVNTVRGAGVLRIPPESEAAERAAQRLGISTLTPGQVSDNPIVIKLENQATATIPAFQRYFRQQQKQAITAARGRIEPQNLANLRSSISQAHDDMRNTILAEARQPRVELTAGGEALREGIESYATASRTLVNDAYKVARSIEEPGFDLRPALTVAGDLQAGAKGTFDTGNLAPIVRELQTLADNPAPKTLPSGQVLSVTDQIRNIRTQLFDLKTPAAGVQPTQPNGQANDLWKALTNVLDSPTNSNNAFLAAWQTASREAAKRRTTLDQLAIVRTLKDETPAQLAFRFAQPRQVDNLRVLRRTIPNEKFAQFQDSFKTSLLDDADNLTRTLDSFDGPTIKALLSPEEQTLFRGIGEGIDRLNSVGVKNALAKQTRNKAFFRQVIDTNDTASIAGLRDMVRNAGNGRIQAGRNTEVGRAVRAGILDNFVDDISRTTDGFANVSDAAINTVINDINRKGLRAFLTLEDIRFLRDMKLVGPKLRAVSDAGTSIQAAETAAGLRGLSFRAFRTLIEQLGVARVYLSPAGRAILVGRGQPFSQNKFLRLTGAALATASIQAPEEPEF